MFLELMLVPTNKSGVGLVVTTNGVENVVAHNVSVAKAFHFALSASGSLQMGNHVATAIIQGHVAKSWSVTAKPPPWDVLAFTFGRAYVRTPLGLLVRTPFQGGIDEFRIYSAAKSARDVQKNMFWAFPVNSVDRSPLAVLGVVAAFSFEEPLTSLLAKNSVDLVDADVKLVGFLGDGHAPEAPIRNSSFVQFVAEGKLIAGALSPLLVFDGVDDFVELPLRSDLPQVSVSVWAKRVSVSAAETGVIFSSKLQMSNCLIPGFTLSTWDRKGSNQRLLRADISAEDRCLSVVSNSNAFEDNVWFNVGLTIDRARATLVFNGAVMSSASFSAPRSISPHPTRSVLGGHFGGNLPFHGSLADLAVWFAALQPSDMRVASWYPSHPAPATSLHFIPQPASSTALALSLGNVTFALLGGGSTRMAPQYSVAPVPEWRHAFANMKVTVQLSGLVDGPSGRFILDSNSEFGNLFDGDTWLGPGPVLSESSQGRDPITQRPVFLHNLVFVPLRDWYGEDSFSYSVADGTAVSEPHVVHLAVSGLNLRPVSGPRGSMLDFNGAQYLELQDFSLPPSFTIEFWTTLRSLADQSMLGKHSLTGASNLALIMLYRGNLYVRLGQEAHALAPVFPAMLNRTFHVSVSFEDATLQLRLLLDAVPAGAATLEHTMGNISGLPWVVGQEWDSGPRPSDFLDGTMAEIRMWNHARDAALVASNYRLPLTGSEPGLIGYWPLTGRNHDQPGIKPPTLVADLSPMKRDGKMCSTHRTCMPRFVASTVPLVLPLHCCLNSLCEVVLSASDLDDKNAGALILSIFDVTDSMKVFHADTSAEPTPLATGDSPEWVKVSGGGARVALFAQQISLTHEEHATLRYRVQDDSLISGATMANVTFHPCCGSSSFLRYHKGGVSNPSATCLSCSEITDEDRHTLALLGVTTVCKPDTGLSKAVIIVSVVISCFASLVLIGVAGVMLLKLHRRREVARHLADYRDGDGVQTKRLRDLDGDALLVKFSDLRILKDVATGSTGKVSLALWHNVPVAVKQFRIMQALERPTQEKFVDECVALRSLRHPNIVQLLGFCTEPLCIVMEWMSRGSLWAVLHNLQTVLPWQLRLRMALETCRAVTCLHTHDVIHRDLKTLNIFVSDSFHVKVGDLGQAKEPTPAMTQMMGTLLWSAPEMFDGTYDSSVDMYSLGIILWELWTREVPFSTNRDAPDPRLRLEFMEYVKEGHRPDAPLDWPEWYGRVASQCWHANPKRRPTVGSLLPIFELAKIQSEASSTGVPLSENRRVRHFLAKVVKRLPTPTSTPTGSQPATLCQTLTPDSIDTVTARIMDAAEAEVAAGQISTITPPDSRDNSPTSSGTLRQAPSAWNLSSDQVKQLGGPSRLSTTNSFSGEMTAGSGAWHREMVQSTTPPAVKTENVNISVAAPSRTAAISEGSVGVGPVNGAHTEPPRLFIEVDSAQGPPSPKQSPSSPNLVILDGKEGDVEAGDHSHSLAIADAPTPLPRGVLSPSGRRHSPKSPSATRLSLRQHESKARSPTAHQDAAPPSPKTRRARHQRRSGSPTPQPSSGHDPEGLQPPSSRKTEHQHSHPRQQREQTKRQPPELERPSPSHRHSASNTEQQPSPQPSPHATQPSPLHKQVGCDLSPSVASFEQGVSPSSSSRSRPNGFELTAFEARKQKPAGPSTAPPETTATATTLSGEATDTVTMMA
eukprot:CAMPEP_0114547310 /NCGR_PEP_ID=MMETSP0114-20121206/4397_1 /TAXON_ID=31324 /ORGANISM="Goniomonas sp, Strain m" /LENGTH=1694 /DNA_ID=CAMNT_0001731859 /DNA_START=209 /DNA_END=5293 /DNA_ORIENTATION=-